MIVARIAETGETVEAHRDLVSGHFECPACRSPLTFKRGRTVVAHFAHSLNSDCLAAEGESRSHLQAKLSLARMFRDQGLQVQLERAHPQARRRIDVVVTVPTGGGAAEQIAVEVQNSPIGVDEIKHRHRVDRRLGYYTTVWVFTFDRLPKLYSTLPGAPVRLPEEMLYLVNRWAQPLNFIDSTHDRMLNLITADAYSDETTWYDQSGDMQSGRGYRLKSTRTVTLIKATPRLALGAGPYDEPDPADPAAFFEPHRHTDPPWAAMYTLSPKLRARLRADGFQAPTSEPQPGTSWLIPGDTQHQVLWAIRELYGRYTDVDEHLEVLLLHIHSGRAWSAWQAHGITRTRLLPI